MKSLGSGGICLLAAFFFAVTCNAKTVEYYFNLTWVYANPDGLSVRPVVGINNSWPLPVIEVDTGDQLVVHMNNGLGNKSASIHFHGMYQNGTNEMDGANLVNQCEVPPGSEFTYNFTVNQNGTYWYHCHVTSCYPDGYRQAFIVHDSDAYFADEYTEEYTLTFSDWYHKLTETIEPTFISLYNPTGAEPIPQAFLVNDTLNTSLPVEPGTTYLLRLINIGAFVAQYFYIEDHEMTIVEMDGVYMEPTKADILYIAVAQRYAVLVTTKNSTDKNYAIVSIADSILLDTIPSDLQLNHTNWLEYNSSAAYPQATIDVDDSSDLDPFDDISLIPADQLALFPEPDHTVELTILMEPLENGKPYALLNNISYTAPKVPTLYTVLSAGNLSTNDAIYGEYTNPVILEHNEVVQIIVNNNDSGSHPFHFHGRNFQVIYRNPSMSDLYEYKDAGDPINYDADNATFSAIPARRDTVIVPSYGSVVIRFVADNPGVWFFHCHIDWHLAQGLGMLFIEAPLKLQEQHPNGVPANHIAACQAAGVATTGNAAGNSVDFLDLSGQNKQTGWIAAGFTPRGIAAFVFSCINAVLGMTFIAIYGWLDPKVKLHTPDPTGLFLKEKNDSEVKDVNEKNDSEVKAASAEGEFDGKTDGKPATKESTAIAEGPESSD